MIHPVDTTNFKYLNCHSTIITEVATNSTNFNFPHQDVDHQTNPENACTRTRDGHNILNIAIILILTIYCTTQQYGVRLYNNNNEPTNIL